MPPQHIPQPHCTGNALRADLNARAHAFAQQHALLHELSTGKQPSVLFGEDDHGRHGNFHPASYRAICRNPAWRARLLKAHTAGRRARPRADWHWRELDCAASSDALLMNIFCHPLVFRSGRVAALLGCAATSAPVFGLQPRLLRERNLVDTTEIDMALTDGDTHSLFEAKLTESDFQTARPALLNRFPGWHTVLDPEALARTPTGAFHGYQLIRGVLAAHAGNPTAEASFTVLCDARRLDLIAQWHTVIGAVHSAALRCRLRLLTWQELCPALPPTLQQFLAHKYGILPATS
ncbi:hypothetical protein [Acidipila sp. EB88]|uniref:PGN_0703 family putative restriction endonuclease n=1 Tax=Acidipila sp. EB88 TaxID=2305226 RepID=UPI000F5F215F|nr:hypothetical protein [Acidipila sp. EB88]RRA47264.1 hypothetical protein D1Y84_02115 [Acidipila sp. EB88]